MADRGLQLVPMNPNCWDSACIALEWLLDRNLGADVIAIQECRLTKDTAVEGARQWALKRGFKLFVSKAEVTGEGPNCSSSGVALAVASTLGASELPLEPLLPFSHRFMATLVNLGSRLGCAVVSIYLQTSIGFAGANVDMLSALRDFLGGLGRLWLVLGDWSMEP